MRNFIIVVSAAIAVQGCVSHSQIMVNSQGQMYRCGSWGQGLGGVIAAEQIHKDCMTSMLAAGYLEIERAGVVGITFAESLPGDTITSILKVNDKSPAAAAGIKPGDKIYQVDDLKVRTMTDARSVLFGIAETPVRLTIIRGDEILTYRIVRAAYTKVYGMPKLPR